MMDEAASQDIYAHQVALELAIKAQFDSSTATDIVRDAAVFYSFLTVQGTPTMSDIQPDDIQTPLPEGGEASIPDSGDDMQHAGEDDVDGDDTDDKPEPDEVD